MKIEYKVRIVQRYLITRYEKTENCGQSEALGEFDNWERAIMIAQRLAASEISEVKEAEFVYPAIQAMAID